MGPGQQPIKSLGFLGWKTTNLGLIPVIFVALFAFSRQTPGLEFTQEGLLSRSRLTEGVVVKSRRVDLIR